ncbi:uncharacterized protein C1orf159 homolog isoform X2 [Pseudorca crassidens]|uniref:uncharacterized protein C1orf159 homolog isoform X2 n=1 Tax=Pseudorca crassidens TaxID=82174 RepID=UPI00352DCAFF
MALQRAVLLASLLVEVASRSSGSASCPHWHWPQLVGRTETPTSGSDSARSWLSQAGDTGVPGCGFWRCPAMCAHTQLLVLQDGEPSSHSAPAGLGGTGRPGFPLRLGLGPLESRMRPPFLSRPEVPLANHSVLVLGNQLGWAERTERSCPDASRGPCRRLVCECSARSAHSCAWTWPFLCGGRAGTPMEVPVDLQKHRRSVQECGLFGRERGQTRCEGCTGLSLGRPRGPGVTFLFHHCPETYVLPFLAASSFDFQSHQLQVATNINNSTVEMPALCPPVAHKARGGGSTHDPGDPREKRRGCREAPRGGWAGSGGEDHPLPTRLLQPTPNRISGWAPRDPLRDSCLWESRCHGMRPGRSQPNFGCWFGHQTLAGHHVLSQGASVRCGRASSPRSGSARHSHRTLTTRGQSPRCWGPAAQVLCGRGGHQRHLPRH